MAQADRDIGIVLEELRNLGVLDDTLVIVTSDHGESLGEHDPWERGPDLWEHNHMVQTNLRIPMILSWPAKLPRGKRVEAMVESVDLLPTICDLLELELPEDDLPEERGLIDGVSLVPLILGASERAKDVSFAIHGDFISAQDERWKLVVPRKPESGDWEEASAELGRLFDLEQDPEETSSSSDIPRSVDCSPSSKGTTRACRRRSTCSCRRTGTKRTACASWATRTVSASMP